MAGLSKGSSGLDVFDVFEGLREAMFRYYDTPFAVSDRSVMEERRRLLDREGAAWREPYIELRLQYASCGFSIEESFRHAGAPADAAGFARFALPEGVSSLYQHQHEGLLTAYRDQRDFVVTAGTGSGKTETFMLPVLADLVAESEEWEGSRGSAPRWWHGKGGYQPSRADEKRPAAVRALVLYPTNALADDQLVRLRRALDSDPARAWLDRNRSGHRFYFGRYTGATPVPGPIGSRTAEPRLRNYLRDLEQREEALKRALQERGEESGSQAGDFLPRVAGAEMHSRWDMQEAPPDVLVTNYSMLNIMLLRPQESSMFEATRNWLHSTPGARFTLILDELHTYRGTAGTEVAYLLRNLQHRLGLDTAPEKLRVLAASASLEKDRDEAFLESFFALPRKRFAVLQGTTVPAGTDSADLSAASAELAEAAEGPLTPDGARALLDRTGAASALRLALAPGGKARTLPLSELASTLFPGVADSGEQQGALRGALRALRSAPGDDLPKLRAHLFFRNIAGIWACSDPECPEVEASQAEGQADGEERRVGKLYGAPVSRCDCGARVLELLYCQTCGDLMLGGYAGREELAKKAFRSALHTDFPDLDMVPDDASTTPTAANYVVYWPRRKSLGTDKPSWTGSASNKGGTVEFEFRRSRFEPGTGRLVNDAEKATGWSFHIVPPKAEDGSFVIDPGKLRPFPTRCPACGDDWEIRRHNNQPIGIDHPRRLASAPVRRMRTGFDKINQVLATEVLDQISDGADRKAIAFSDSRDDAADLASGLALRHYQDLIRLLAAGAVTEQGDPTEDLRKVRSFYKDKSVGREEALTPLKRLMERYPSEVNALRAIWRDDLEAQPEREPELEAVVGGFPSLDALADDLQGDLLHMGTNPAGPAASLQETESGTRWTALFDWSSDCARKPGLTSEEEDLLQRMRENLRREFLNGLFSSAGRDFESLGLGWLCLTTDAHALEAPPESDTALARASLRILGHMRRFHRLRAGQEKPPAPLKKFWAAAAERYGLDPDDIRDRVLRVWGPAVTQYTIDPAKVALRPGSGKVWTCSSCRRRHLHPGALVCTKCYKPLPAEADAADTAEEALGLEETDYYAWKAASGSGKFRLHTAELTGQTDRLEAQARQWHFQDVFLEEDTKQTDGLELLSVTTTMEAGVDVGPLNVVLMANMPPTRFNYQQRVGRAGRRTSPVAIALTVCRGRSHDDHYFARPELITNAPTPPPYLSVEMPSIFRRVLLGEVLRMAFEAADAKDDRQAAEDMTRNVHGQFGLASDWHLHRPKVAKWIDDNPQKIQAAAAALQAFTEEPVSSIDPVACVRGLLAGIDKVAEQAVGHSDLSQRLAEAGLLPMFGFPTRVRMLYKALPRQNFPWPPPGAISRDLALALTKFAPGSETPQDGRLIKSAGVAAFTPGGRFPKAAEEPFGPERMLAMCRLCAHVTELGEGEEPGSCPACGAAKRYYSAFPVREPGGFRADRDVRDYDGVREWSEGSTSTRTAADLQKTAPRVERETDDWLVVHSGTGSRYMVNTNGGKLFRFRKDTRTPWKGYLHLASQTAEADLEVALGAVQHGDMLFLGSKAAEDPDRGLRFDISAYEQVGGFTDAFHGRRAAWYSLSALLRRTAAPLLDVEPDELLSGIHGSTSKAAAPVMAFLADSLENGAGFSTHLGSSGMIEEFLGAVDRYLDECADPPHAETCSSSCYDCLRDYKNMRVHSLLDWRLGRDLFRALRGKGLSLDTEWHRLLLKRWADDYPDLQARVADTASGPAAVIESDFTGEPVAVIVKHPLESLTPSCASPRLAAAEQAFLDEHGSSRIAYVDSFLLDRTPAAVAEALRDFADE
ncbi:DEAD/DEAH box helicase [Streptomyces sp. URMC 125]|uniref:DEAD/DEAH box helicase n=1 Tax=Streptomyces sp. URMC 125 TaxID=3423419 RepID=UPI003F198017